MAGEEGRGDFLTIDSKQSINHGHCKNRNKLESSNGTQWNSAPSATVSSCLLDCKQTILHRLVTPLCKKQKQQKTCYRWHMTCDWWHMTHYRWGEVNILSKFQLPSSYALGVKVFLRYLYKGWLTQLINYWNSDIGVCKTASPTPGLLNKEILYSL